MISINRIRGEMKFRYRYFKDIFNLLIKLNY